MFNFFVVLNMRWNLSYVMHFFLSAQRKHKSPQIHFFYCSLVKCYHFFLSLLFTFFLTNTRPFFVDDLIFSLSHSPLDKLATEEKAKHFIINALRSNLALCSLCAECNVHAACTSQVDVFSLVLHLKC